MTQPLRVAVAGLGTVGSAVVRLLDRRANALASGSGRAIEVRAVSARSRRDRGLPLDRFQWFDDPVALARDPGSDVLVELIGGQDGAALDAVSAALEVGKPVVTANKALLARHGVDLARRAEAASVTIGFEAAVAGGVPIVRTLRESLLGARIERVRGILNGTCNYILTRMEAEGLSFAECLSDAQRLGYAEADPGFDIEGHDTAHKLALLTSLAFGTRVDPEGIHVEGIASITQADLRAADELGFRIKLLGVATRTEAGIEQRVHPTMVPKGSAIAQVGHVTNAVAIESDAVPQLALMGPGAGGEATASAVIGDLVDVARGLRVAPFGRPADELAEPVRAPMQTHRGGYYVRLLVHDRPGAAAAIASRLAEQGISLESIVQRRQPGQAADAVPVILTTHATHESAIRAALAAVSRDGHVTQAPQLIRIERE